MREGQSTAQLRIGGYGFGRHVFLFSFDVAVVQGKPEALVCQVTGQACTHYAQTHQAKVGLHGRQLSLHAAQ